MFVKLVFCLCFCSVLVLISSKIEGIRGKKSNKDELIVYITSLCDNNPEDCGLNRYFRCFVFSETQSTIYWVFKPCFDDSCQFKEIVPDQEFSKELIEEFSDELFYSTVKFDSEQFGTLQCVANNTLIHAEDAKQINAINFTPLNLIQKNVKFVSNESISTEKFIWTIDVQGSPQPLLHLYLNGKRAESTECKDRTVKFPSTTVEYDLSLPNETKITFQYPVNCFNGETNFHVLANNLYEKKMFNLTAGGVRFLDVNLEVHHLQETYSILRCWSNPVRIDNFTWYFKPCFEDNCDYTNVTEGTIQREDKFSLSSYIKVNSNSSGVFRCVVYINITFLYIFDAYQEIDNIQGSLDIFGHDSIIKIDKNTKNLRINFTNPFLLTCAASSINHTGEISWALSETGEKTFNSRIVSSTKNAVFTFQKTLNLTGTGLYRSGGTFFCRARLKNNSWEYQKIKISFLDRQHRSKIESVTWPYYILGVFFFITIIFVYIIYRNQKKMKELKIAGLANFENGAVELLNPDLTIEEQADLLPYDKRYEFPIENLKLGEQIGSGAFGVVMKGEAKEIFPGESVTPVAVKMVNKYVGDIYIKALASELKIMIHLGKHVNIVNLLGACTKNIVKRELLIIVEYCRFGNLRDYLLNHRQTFIDQINPETGQIDFQTGSDLLEKEYSQVSIPVPTRAKKEPDISSSSTIETEAEIDSERSQLDTKRHLKGDILDFNKPICTKDLVIWSFQVAQGMEYLSSRKILHGDLAARNILLTEENIAKICDFGLSRNMYQQDVYKKQGDEMLPVKWMAIEAITHKTFSVQSDVWSFGILLWEMFSLSRTPYPGVIYDEDFCTKLSDGYRMKSPEFATQDIYEIMLHCWNTEPQLRPSFTRLTQKIGLILDKTLVQHYVDMNVGYLQMNAQKFETNTDYLAMIGLQPLHGHGYVNHAVRQSLEDDERDTYI